GLGFEDGCDGAHRLTVLQPGYPHPGGVPTLGRDLFGVHPDDISTGREDQYLIGGCHGERGHHRAPGSGDLHTPHPRAATPLAVEGVEAGPLAVAARAHEEHHGTVPGDGAADEGVLAVLELDA